MSVIVLFDHSEIVISEDQAKKLKDAIDSSRVDHVEINGNWLRLSAIAQIKPTQYRPIEYEQQQLPGVTSLTDKERADRRKKIAAMKQRFIEKQAKRKALIA